MRDQNRPGFRSVLAFGWVAAMLIVMALAAPAVAQESTETSGDQLAEGQELYTVNCSACHQPGGVGLPGAIPPLANNSNVTLARITEVTSNGASGPLEVNGQVYDSVMPSFPTLTEDQVAAIFAYIDNGFVGPAAAADTTDSGAGPVAGTSLPGFVGALSNLAFLLAAVVAAMVLGPRVVAVIGNRGELSPLDAGLKTAIIVGAVVIGTVIIPSAMLNSELFGRLPGQVGDIVAATVWLGALAIIVGAIWWAQREDRI